MYYIIQNNVFQEPRYDQIFDVMEELELEYEIVEFQPNSNVLEFRTKRLDVFVYGSVTLAKITANFNWNPGSFYGENHEFEKYAEGFGEHVINYGSRICEFNQPIDWTNSELLFIKPSKDAKVFTGKIFNCHEWADFVYNSLNDPQNDRIKATTLIQISEPYRIVKEARIWIVNSTVITSSYYKFHGNVDFEESVSKEGLDFAQKMANLFHVAEAYVMDVALTFEGWKIMEVNCINSAGFYKGNVKKIILALEAFYSSQEQ